MLVPATQQKSNIGPKGRYQILISFSAVILIQQCRGKSQPKGPNIKHKQGEENKNILGAVK